MANNNIKQSPHDLVPTTGGRGTKAGQERPLASAKTDSTTAAYQNAPWSTFGTGEGSNTFDLIRLEREGVNYQLFEQFSAEAPFSIADWSGYLHLSERTIQRYKKERLSFESSPSARILEIILLFNQGVKVFGQKEKFIAWLTTRSVALGHIKPTELLDSSFGINLLKDELIKIAHGVLA